MDFISSLRAQKELDTLLKDLTNYERDYVESYCMSFDLYSDTSFFDFDKLEKLDLTNLLVSGDGDTCISDIHYDEFPF